jgi:hypothetical protein
MDEKASERRSHEFSWHFALGVWPQSVTHRAVERLVPILCQWALYRPDLSWLKTTGVQREVFGNKPFMVWFGYLSTTGLAVDFSIRLK